MAIHLEVQREQLRTVRVVEDDVGAPRSGEVVMAVESFALTANNVTYALVGGPMRYWDFFPAMESGWGRVPVWGFGRVVESAHPEVPVGQRLYGYFPMGTHLKVEPGRVDAAGFVDAAAHRRPMAGVYNHYRFEPAGEAELRSVPDRDESVRALLYPLFVTGYLIADSILDDGDPASAPALVVSSASSKTALGLARAARRAGLRTVGLTSPSRVDALDGIGAWDRVVAYTDVEQLASADGPWAYVDIAGDATITESVHRTLGSGLRRSLGVGITHWEPRSESSSGPRPDPIVAGADPSGGGVAREMFFAPARIAQRTADWGRAGLDERMDAAWADFATSSVDWLRIEYATGSDEVTAAWLNLLDGHQPFEVGRICSI